jgi:cation diffusion facilitator CzcD-associated flavoprotein CzcO
MQFETRVQKAHWDADSTCWRLVDQNGHSYSSRYLITGLGLLSDPTLPNIPGVEDFKGEAFHTSRWPKSSVSLKGKNVGVIGVGATAIQLIPEVAKEAKSLTVFQRTPNWAMPLHNAPISKEEMETIRKGYPETLKKIDRNALAFLHEASKSSIWEASPEEREAFWELLYSQPGFGFWVSNYKETMTDRKANALLSDFVAKKIRQRVKDPWTADKLIPKTYGFGMRRVPMETFFYEAFNEPHVRLVDLFETPIEKIHAEGVKTTNEDFNLDVIVYATGFSASKCLDEAVFDSRD